MDYYCYHLHLCTSLHLWTLLFCIYGLCYYYRCCTALLFSYSAIFIAASVRNKLIHSFIQSIWTTNLSKSLRRFPLLEALEAGLYEDCGFLNLGVCKVNINLLFTVPCCCCCCCCCCCWWWWWWWCWLLVCCCISTDRCLVEKININLVSFHSVTDLIRLRVLLQQIQTKANELAAKAQQVSTLLLQIYWMLFSVCNLVNWTHFTKLSIHWSSHNQVRSTWPISTFLECEKQLSYA